MQVTQGEGISAENGGLRRRNKNIQEDARKIETMPQRGQIFVMSDDGDLSRARTAIDVHRQISLIAEEGTVCLAAYFLAQDVQ